MIRRLIALCLFLIVKALLSTLRVKREGDVIDRSGVVGFLHGEQLPLLLHRPQAHDLITPISLSKDGELQVMVMRWFGIRAVRGSTSRGGSSCYSIAYEVAKNRERSGLNRPRWPSWTLGSYLTRSAVSRQALTFTLLVL